MMPQELVARLLSLPDREARRQFLAQHHNLLDDDVAQTLKAQADTFLRSDMKRALELADLLLVMADLRQDPLNRALGLLAEANARSIGGIGQYQQAVGLYDQAAQIYQRQGQPILEARARVGKVYSLALLGRYAEALETGRLAGQVLETAQQWLPLVNLTMNLAIVRGRQREDARALAQFDRARSLSTYLDSNRQELLALIESNRAIVLRNLGRFDASIAASQIAWQVAASLEQRGAVAHIQEDLAFTFLLLGRHNEALELLDQAHDVFLADGRTSDAVLLELVTSHCLLQLRRFHGVLEKCRTVGELCAQAGLRRELAEAKLNEAAAYTGLGRYGEAREALAEARRLFEEEGNRVWMLSADLEVAALLYHQQDYEHCLATARCCARDFQALGLSVLRARSSLVAARAAAALNLPAEARQLAQAALRAGKDHELSSLIYQSRHLLGQIAAANGDHQEALGEYELAINELERLRNHMMVEFRADFLEDKQTIYSEIVGLFLALDQPELGLSYAERAKSRALLDLLAYRLDLSIQAKGKDDHPLVEELVRLRTERDRLYRRWQRNEEHKAGALPESNGSQRAMAQDVLSLEQRITGLWHKLLIRNAEYARDAALWQVRTEPVQPYLAPDVALLEYFEIGGKFVAFVVTAERVECQPLDASPADIRRLLQMLQLNLRAVPVSKPDRIVQLSEHAQAILGQLHQKLLDPVRERLDVFDKLIIVPHGPLHYLPFHALYDGHHYLVQDFEIAHLPGASLLRFCQEARNGATGLLSFGHSYDGRLPNAPGEARSIANLFRGQAWLEDEATSRRLQEQAPAYSVLHIAAHGDFRADNPLFSGLALADGWLTTLDIFNLRLNASLVTLSACQTGRNLVGGGDELLGLMRAFMYAGAASLVLSLWSVEDQATACLMEDFYRELLQDSTKGAALRTAQRRFIDNQHGLPCSANIYGHPYFWAPFYLVGDGGPL